jgi:hypothetical protein
MELWSFKMEGPEIHFSGYECRRMLILFFRSKGGKHISESSLLPRLKNKKF